MKIEIQHPEWIEPALQGKRINAVKAFRGMKDPSIPLKESVHFIDHFMSLFPPSLARLALAREMRTKTL